MLVLSLVAVGRADVVRDGEPVPAAVSADPLFEDEATGDPVDGFPDPLEPVNRVTFGFNRALDRWVFNPVTHVYALVVPTPARKAVRRVLSNLNSPSVFVNDILQLSPLNAAETLVRFGINTTVGLLGLFDPADAIGLERHDADFGQTLALVGVPSGPYLILPAIGPTTVRDGTGYLVDVLFRPTTYLLTPLAQVVFTSIREGSAGIAARDAHGPALRALESSSIDYYASMRNAFYQDRLAQIESRRHEHDGIAFAASQKPR